MKNTTRIGYVDLASAIMILWMMISHAIVAHSIVNAKADVDIVNPNYLFPYFHFFMPWFFYKSGYFFKHASFKERIKKDSKKLLTQFFIWSIVGYVLYIIILGIVGGFTLRRATYSVVRGLFFMGYIPINDPLWFLLTLFIVRIIANVILPKKETNRYWLKLFGVILLGYLISYFAYLYKNDYLPLWVANSAAGLSFFAMGYGLGKFETKPVVISLSIILYVVSIIGGGAIVGMKSNTLVCGEYLLNMPYCLAGIVTLNLLCRLIEGHISHVIQRPLNSISKYTMIIYVTHGLLYETTAHVVNGMDLTSIKPYTIIMILCEYIVIIPIFCLISQKMEQNKILNLKVTR